MNTLKTQFKWCLEFILKCSSQMIVKSLYNICITGVSTSRKQILPWIGNEVIVLPQWLANFLNGRTSIFTTKIEM